MTDRIRFDPRPSQRALLEFAGTRTKRMWMAKMGAGKSAAAIEHLRRELEDSYRLEKALIVAPGLVARDTWPREFAKWEHARPLGAPKALLPQDFGFKRIVDVLDGQGGLSIGDWRTVRKQLLSYKERVHTVSWDQLWWITKAYNKTWPYSHVILDESTFAGNGSSQRFKAIHHAVKHFEVDDLLEMAGAPIPNGYEKLWSQVKLLDAGVRMGPTLTAFHEMWCRPLQKGPQGQVYKWEVRPHLKEKLQKLISEVACSVEVDLGVDVAPVDQWITLPDGAREVYDDLERDLVHRFDPESVVLAANSAVLVGKMMQVCNGAIYDNDRIVQLLHDVKLDRLEEIIDSTSGGVLLAYPYKHDWMRISERFKFAQHILEHGAIDKFSKGQSKLTCLHPASGAHGIDSLQLGGHNVVWFGVPHNYEHYAQLNARLARPGQQQTVFVHRIMAEDTLEHDVAYVTLAEREEEQEGLLRAVRWRLR